MSATAIIFCLLILLCGCPSVWAQERYPFPACTSSASGKAVGDRVKLHLPNRAVVRKGRDVDYSAYAIGFGPKKNRVWLEGIYGPTATSGKPPDKWLLASVEVTRRAWKFGEVEGVDVKGKLANGNYWRYFGQFGESANYYDVPADAAAYFDGIINNACYQDWR